MRDDDVCVTCGSALAGRCHVCGERVPQSTSLIVVPALTMYRMLLFFTVYFMLD